MKNRKIISVLSLILLVCCCFCVGCKEKEESKGTKPIAVIDGFEIQSIEVVSPADNYYNIEIGIENNNEESATFNYTQIHIKFGGLELAHNGSDLLFEAGEYWKMSFQIEVADSNLSVGDTVEVYYQDRLLKNVSVTEF